MFSPRNLFKNFDTSVFLSSTVLNILSCSLFILLALSCCLMFLFVFIVGLLAFMVSSLFCFTFSFVLFFSLFLFCSFVLLFLFSLSISSGESGMYFSLTSHSVNSVVCSSSYSSSSSSFDNTFFRKTEEISNFKMLFK